MRMDSDGNDGSKQPFLSTYYTDKDKSKSLRIETSTEFHSSKALKKYCRCQKFPKLTQLTAKLNGNSRCEMEPITSSKVVKGCSLSNYLHRIYVVLHIALTLSIVGALYYTLTTTGHLETRVAHLENGFAKNSIHVKSSSSQGFNQVSISCMCIRTPVGVFGLL